MSTYHTNTGLCWIADAMLQESKEAYFVALRRKPDVERSVVFPEDET